MKRLIWLLLAAACSSSSGPGADAPPAGPDSRPGAADARLVDAAPGAADAPVIIGGDGGTVTCAMTLDAHCGVASCIRDASDLPTCAPSPGPRLSTSQCGTYTTFTSAGIDTAEVDYYNPSGALVAVVSVGNGRTLCTGGPAQFIVPTTCSQAIEFLPCPDGGK